MDNSLVVIQRALLLQALKNAAKGEWKVLIMDDESRRLVYSVLKEDDILSDRVTNIEEIEKRRQPNPEMPAVYLISPLPYVVDCLLSDIEHKRYRQIYLLWTSILPPKLREKLDISQSAKKQISSFRVINLDFSPREARIVTLQDPYSFPTLFHPGCNNLVTKHIAVLAQRIMAVCVSLGEYPAIRYYQPPNPSRSHEAHVLSSFIANAVQKELDIFAQWNRDFLPQDSRPKSALYIVDRSLDLVAPFLHEFTYQAMAHDLLPIRDGSKVTYQVTMNEGRPNEEKKQMRLEDRDKIWSQFRHEHMSNVLVKLDQEFKKFLSEHSAFAKQDAQVNVSDLKDMMVGMSEFHEQKDSYALHTTMAQACMDVFNKCKLADIALLEQTLAMGTDEDYRKPKNVAEQVIRMLDEPAIVAADRLRLIALYILFRNGSLDADTNKLLLHAQLPPTDDVILNNLELLGARIHKQLKDNTPATPLFPPKQPPPHTGEEVSISRYEPVLKRMLEEHILNSLSLDLFPYVKPELAPSHEEVQSNMASASLRSVKSTWASRTKNSSHQKQRIIIFMAGGATFSEARACYEVSEQANRDVYLMSSHMLTPGLFLQQLGDLTSDRRSLDLPLDKAARKAPSYAFEDPAPPRDPNGPGVITPLNDRMGGMSLNGSNRPSGAQIKLDSTTTSDSTKLRKKKHLFSSRK